MFFYLILALFIIVSAFQYLLEYINIKNLKLHGQEIPYEFKGEIDAELLEKTRNYTIDKNRIGLLSSFLGDIVTVLFFFCGILAWYSSFIDSLKLNYIVSGLVFFMILNYASSIVGIPFSLYTTFVIEKKYGFNTKNFKLWFSDSIKALIIGTVFMCILISAALGLVHFFQYWWWLLVWGFFLVFSLFMMYISPYVIEPLFNKFTPLDNEDFSERIKELSEKAGIKVNQVFKMDASKRSKHTNAYFTGIGKVKRIVLFDTLLEKLTEDEILAVLAHEAGHWKKKHLLKSLIIFETAALVFIYIAFIILEQRYLASIFNIKSPDPFFAEVIILLFMSGILIFPLTPLFCWFSRRNERQADDFACNICNSGDALASALVKLSKDNLSNLHPHPLYSKFYYSHPPAVERIKYLKEFTSHKDSKDTKKKKNEG
jgi:STE24 endopeptidase